MNSFRHSKNFPLAPLSGQNLLHANMSHNLLGDCQGINQSVVHLLPSLSYHVVDLKSQPCG